MSTGPRASLFPNAVFCLRLVSALLAHDFGHFRQAMFGWRPKFPFGSFHLLHHLSSLGFCPGNRGHLYIF
ncbi:MAG: hypothetical protein A3F75_07715 [Betaproteobacteria bacterium RIFCSPLOWO2_12_FULL_64_23]|nr:MAG: hypothetical protein A3F75_07715 [Betaproteobacteria bacterium RIFCSPLOWO2_12_FULL_64_23]